MAYVIVPLSVALGVLGYSLIAAWYVVPVLNSVPRQRGLEPLILMHIFRYVGTWFLISGVASNELSPSFAVPAAYGDLIATVLALLAVIALRSKWPIVLTIIWVFNIFGTLDLLNALLQGFLHIQWPGI